MSQVFSDDFGSTAENLTAYGNGWEVIATDGGTPTVDGQGNLSVGTTQGPTLVINSNTEATYPNISATIDAYAGVGFVFGYQAGQPLNFLDIEFHNDFGSGIFGSLAINGTENLAGSTTDSLGHFNFPEYQMPVQVTLNVATDGKTITAYNGSTVLCTWNLPSVVPAGLCGFRNGGGGNGKRNVVGPWVVSDNANASLGAGTLATSSATTTSIALTLTGASGGTAPYSVQFQQAPDASGSPGTFANIGTAGTATSYTATGLTAGTAYWFRATVTDSESSPATSSSAAVKATTQAAANPTYSLSLAPPSVSLTQGASATTTVTITPSGGFNGAVALSTLGLPSGVTASFAPASVTGGGTSVLSFTATSTASLGASPFSVQGASGSLTQSASGTITTLVGQTVTPTPTSGSGLTADQANTLALVATNLTTLQMQVANLATLVGAIPTQPTSPLTATQTGQLAQITQVYNLLNSQTAPPLTQADANLVVAAIVARFPNLDASTGIATGYYRATPDGLTTRVISRSTNLEICRFPTAGRITIDFSFAGTPA